MIVCVDNTCYYVLRTMPSYYDINKNPHSEILSNTISTQLQPVVCKTRCTLAI